MAYVYITPPASPNTKNRKEVCPWAPSREGNSNKVIIDFCMMDKENRFSTPLKTRHVNPDAPGAPIKRYEGSLLDTTLDDFRTVLFPGLAESLRKRIKEERRKIIKSSECPGAPVKIMTKRKSNKINLKSAKKSLFVNKENYSLYSRIL